jgi:hypothetical protein
VGPILLLTGNAPPADLERCRGFADFLRRRALLDGEETPAPGASPEPGSPEPRAAAKALLDLAGRGLLFYEAAEEGAVEVFYIPSREATRGVFEAGAGTGFPEAVQKKQTAAFRTSVGAILRFPLEQGEAALEVFITDWSPCPAACAVAIHRGHPLAADLEKPAGPWFTGRYVRHPLTGDLLPVWVADWVRPDFGTGAVLVNPAHDRNDLAFGRAIGLPIRFALVPSEYDGSPATWPDPPLVKSGRTVRTGPYDGLSVEEAVERYFQVMAERGLAERHRDLQAGRWRIGRLVADPEGGLAWSRARWTVLPARTAGSDSEAVRCDAAGLLAAALAIPEGVRPLLVCPAGELTGELLGLRLLWQDLTGQTLAPSAVFLIQKVQESKTEASAEVVRLAALVGAPAQQVAVIKQQVVEQVQRFLRTHQELLAQAAEAGGDGAGTAETPAQRAFAKIKAAVGEGDPAKAFSLLQQTQKQMRDLAPEERAAALPGYFVLAGAVAGLEGPAGLEAGPVWSRIS